MYGYVTRFVPQRDALELINLYHLARTALAGQPCGRLERLQWAARTYAKEHAEFAQRTAAVYKDLECLTAP
jgi:hypothetical protein